MIDTIICGKAIEVMAGMDEESVDITITSPPYNQLGSDRSVPKGWSTSPGMFKNDKWRKRIVSGNVYPDARPEDEYQKWVWSLVNNCLGVSKGLVWLNHKVRYRKNVGIHPLRFLDFPLYHEVIWDRGGSMALNCKRFAPSHEAIYAFGKRHWWNDESNKLMSVWRIAPSRNKEHPCSFPIELVMRLIIASCPPGGIVFDPCVGSGTTAVAAIRTGRHYIGIDINEEYCQIARESIEKEREQLRLSL